MDEFYAKQIKDFEIKFREIYKEAMDVCIYKTKKSEPNKDMDEKASGLNKTSSIDWISA